MMETNKKHTENALKQALQRRQPGRLPSNFNYRMMEQIRLEAEKTTEAEGEGHAVRHDCGYIAIVGSGSIYACFQIGIQFQGVLVRYGFFSC